MTRARRPDSPVLSRSMSLQDRSSEPSIGTMSCPLQEGPSSSLAATGGDVAGGADRDLRSPEIGEKNMPRLLIGLYLVEDVVHERGHRQRSVAHVRARDQVVHRQQCQDQSGVPGHPAAGPETQTPRRTSWLWRASHAVFLVPFPSCCT